MRRTTKGAALAASVLLATLVSAGPVTAAGSSTRPGPAPTSLPVFIDPAADLTAHPDRANESWYLVAHVSAGGHRYGFVAHYVTTGVGSNGIAASAVSVTNETTGWYTQSSLGFPARTGLSGKPGMDIQTSNINWTGDATKMTLRATVPEGRIDVTLRPRGPVLYNMGTGYFPMFADPQYPNYEYAFPTVDTAGTLTLNGRTQPLRGQSWIDRQWGPMPDFAAENASWTWMDLNLSNGEKISLWDTRKGQTVNGWGTVLSPDGTHTLAEATTVYDPSSLWTSPTTGRTYATRWTVTIPSKRATLHVTVTVKDQELPTPIPRYEGSATVTGTYDGRRVSGHTYVEITGATSYVGTSAGR